MWHTGYKHPAEEWKSFEDAQQAQERFNNENPDSDEFDLRSPIFQWDALQRIKKYQKSYEGGFEYALFQAIRVCSNFDIPLPSWAANAYIKGFDAVNSYREKSWDDAFGNPTPKGKNLTALRKKRTLMYAVLNEIHAIRNKHPKTPIDTALFEKVGQKFNIGKTLTSEYYYAAKKTNIFP